MDALKVSGCKNGVKVNSYKVVAIVQKKNMYFVFAFACELQSILCLLFKN